MFPSNLVRLIDELEKKELVRRGDNASDRRSYTLVLTKKGQGIRSELIALTEARQYYIKGPASNKTRISIVEISRMSAWRSASWKQ